MKQKATTAKIKKSDSRFFLYKVNKSWRVIIFLLVAVLYGSTLLNGYNMDDELVARNHLLTSKGIAAIPEIFTSPYYQDNQGYAYEYRPIVLLTFAVENQFFGDNPLVSHVFNLLLYGLACVVLTYVLKQLFNGINEATVIAIALVFVVHASHTEVVSSIKNRDELLALLFSLLSLRATLTYVSTHSTKWHVIWIAVSFTLALLSKTTVISMAWIIPIGATLFAPVTLLQLFSISMSLAVPVFVAVNFNTGYERIFFTLTVAFLPLFFFLATHTTYTKALFQSLYKRMIGSNANAEKPFAVSSDKASILKSIKPEYQTLKSKEAIFVVVLFLFSVLASFFHYLWITLFFLGLLGFLAYKGNKAVAWWSKSCILLLIPLLSFYFPSDSKELNAYVKLSSLCVLYVFFIKRDQLAIPAILAYLLFFVRICYSSFNHIEELSLFAGFLLCLVPYLRYVVGGVALYSTFSLLPFSGMEEALVDIFSGLFFGSVAFGLHRKKTSVLYVSIALIFLCNLLFVWFAIRFSHQPVHELTNAIKSNSEKYNPKIIAIRQDRPLHYTEVCVSHLDPFTNKLGTSFEVLFHYFKKTVFPYPLAYYYGYQIIKPMKITDGIPLISLIIHFTLFVIALYVMHKDPLISFGLFVYLFSVSTFSNYVQYLPGMVADRYLLIPSLGWSIVLVGVLRKFSGVADNARNITWESIKPTAKYPFLAILLLYSTLTFCRNFNWKDDLTLFRHDIDYVDESAQAHNLLALHLMQHSSTETNAMVQQDLAKEALHHFKRTLQIYPAFFNVAYDIGRVYMGLGATDSAIVYFEQALVIDSLTLPTVHIQLADLYFDQNNIDKSNQHLAAYIRVSPTDYTGYSKLSYNYFVIKDYQNSIAVNKQAIRNIPSLVEPYVNMAYAFNQMGIKDSALIYLREANLIAPNNAAVQNAIRQVGN